MKTLLLSFLLALLVINIQAESIISIPDENFYRALIRLGVDKNKDFVIQQSEAENVTRLDVPGLSIKSFEGISYFSNLEYFNCSYNYLYGSALRFSTLNKKLRFLYCQETALLRLDVSMLSGLELLNCGITYIDSLDLSKNLLLKSLRCDNSSIRSLNLSNNLELEYLDATSCSALKYLNVSKEVKLKSLIIVNSDVSSFELPNHPALTYLDISYNPIVRISLEHTPNLDTLLCVNSKLNSLDVIKNTQLSYLDCNMNNLKRLMLANNLELAFLNCQENLLYNVCISPIVDTESWKKDDIATFDKYCKIDGVSTHYTSRSAADSPKLIKSTTVLGQIVKPEDFMDGNLYIYYYEDGSILKKVESPK